MKRTIEVIVGITMRQWCDGHWEASIADAEGLYIGVVRNLDELAHCLEQVRQNERLRAAREAVPPKS